MSISIVSLVRFIVHCIKKIIIGILLHAFVIRMYNHITRKYTHLSTQIIHLTMCTQFVIPSKKEQLLQNSPVQLKHLPDYDTIY